MADDVVERTLCQLPQVHVFKIPARKSAEGYRANDWPKDPTWTGKLRIVAKGNTAAIMLLDEKNQLFAVCPVTDDAAVERTLDSGRYFVLRIKNAQDRSAFIGIAFNERSDAFDFNVALSEFKSECERELQASKMANDVVSGPMKDLSLKEGEKLKIKVNLRKKNADDQPEKTSFDTPIYNTTTKPTKGLLPPPKDLIGVSPYVATSNTATNNTHMPNQTSDDSFGIFGGSGFQSASDPFATKSSSDPFGSSSFSDPFSTAANPTKPIKPQKATPTTATTTTTTTTSSTATNLLDL